jgi:hypothetical protein
MRIFPLVDDRMKHQKLEVQVVFDVVQMVERLEQGLWGDSRT